MSKASEDGSGTWMSGEFDEIREPVGSGKCQRVFCLICLSQLHDGNEHVATALKAGVRN